MKSFLICLATMSLVCCTNTKTDPPEELFTIAAETTDFAPVKMDALPAIMAPPRPGQYEQKLIREANLIFEVAEVNKAYDSIKEIIKEFNAYASNEDRTNNDTQVGQKIDVRVEEKYFASIIERILVQAKKIRSRNISIRDVTEEYTDVSARLNAKKEIEKRYFEILHQARTVKDMLAIEEQLGSVREEIESMEARMKVMTKKISYSTIHIEFSEHIVSSEPGFGHQLAFSFQTGWNKLVNAALSVVASWPLIVAAFASCLFIWRLVKRRRKATDTVVVN